ncbi:hypothetical protein Cgig2_012403 [Carnegiea gigantea]|uniref:Uncharacterized protein n=1 Tax=Carnegiea gigantea TaxID=171969 RepID=A0A9Q1JMF2_9CARY|nr:hypothetical protein Cgig2_012403 [Carnegiea gigantea]
MNALIAGSKDLVNGQLPRIKSKSSATWHFQLQHCKDYIIWKLHTVNFDGTQRPKFIDGREEFTKSLWEVARSTSISGSDLHFFPFLRLQLGEVNRALIMRICALSLERIMLRGKDAQGPEEEMEDRLIISCIYSGREIRAACSGNASRVIGFDVELKASAARKITSEQKSVDVFQYPLMKPEWGASSFFEGIFRLIYSGNNNM